jgi:hypothetical protein
MKKRAGSAPVGSQGSQRRNGTLLATQRHRTPPLERNRKARNTARRRKMTQEGIA